MPDRPWFRALAAASRFDESRASARVTRSRPRVTTIDRRSRPGPCPDPATRRRSRSAMTRPARAGSRGRADRARAPGVGHRRSTSDTSGSGGRGRSRRRPASDRSRDPSRPSSAAWHRSLPWACRSSGRRMRHCRGSAGSSGPPRGHRRRRCPRQLPGFTDASSIVKVLSHCLVVAGTTRVLESARSEVEHQA